MSVKERLIQFIAHEKMTKRAFEVSIGAANGYINSIRQSIQPDRVSRIALNYPALNIAWLLTGEGEMLRASAPVHSDSELTDRNSLKHFYEMDVTASNIENLSDNEQNAPFRRLLIPGYEGCVAFNVAGESMLPTARPGDLAAIDPRPVERIVNGEIYLLVTRDGQRMIKRLMRLPDDTGVRCFSDNDKKQWYAPFDIEAEMVVHAYRVRGFISFTHLV